MTSKGLAIAPLPPFGYASGSIYNAHKMFTKVVGILDSEKNSQLF